MGSNVWPSLLKSLGIQACKMLVLVYAFLEWISACHIFASNEKSWIEWLEGPFLAFFKKINFSPLIYLINLQPDPRLLLPLLPIPNLMPSHPISPLLLFREGEPPRSTNPLASQISSGLNVSSPTKAWQAAQLGESDPRAGNREIYTLKSQETVDLKMH